MFKNEYPRIEKSQMGIQKNNTFVIFMIKVSKFVCCFEKSSISIIHPIIVDLTVVDYNLYFVILSKIIVTFNIRQLTV